MTNKEKLKQYGAHQKALALFDLVVADLSPLAQNSTLYRLIAQQFASADSIAANIEEGYGRGSRKDYAHFLIIARGSAQETCGRYERLKHWLPPHHHRGPRRSVRRNHRDSLQHDQDPARTELAGRASFPFPFTLTFTFTFTFPFTFPSSP